MVHPWGQTLWRSNSYPHGCPRCLDRVARSLAVENFRIGHGDGSEVLECSVAGKAGICHSFVPDLAGQAPGDYFALVLQVDAGGVESLVGDTEL